MSVSGKAFDSHLLRRLYQYTKPYRKMFYGALVLTISLALIAPLRPILTQYALDNFVTTDNEKGLMWLTIAMIVILIVQSCLQYFHSWYTNLLGQEVIRDLRTSLFDRMMNFKLNYFDKTPVGTTVTRSVS